MNKFVLLTVFFMLFAVNATTLASNYYNPQSARDGSGREWISQNNVTIQNITFCVSVPSTLSGLQAGLCRYNGTSGSGCIDSQVNSSYCVIGASCEPDSGCSFGKKVICSFPLTHLIEYKKYWMWHYNYSGGCGINTAHGYNVFYPFGRDNTLHTYTSDGNRVLGDIVGYNFTYKGTVNITKPLNGDIIEYDLINYTTDYLYLDLCNNPSEYRGLYTSEDILLNSNTSSLVGDSTIEWIIMNNTGYGRNFYVLSILYCDEIIEASDKNIFSISINDTITNYVNDSLLDSIYYPLCFYTPLPESVCNTTYQDVYIYVNDVLYYNLNNTNETVFCFRDRNLDGLTNMEIKTYCSDSKALIDNQFFSFTFHYQLKYLGADFSGFIGNVMPAGTKFLLLFIIPAMLGAMFLAIGRSVNIW